MLDFEGYLEMNHINESYANLANTLRGLRSTVETVGIMSAENPHGEAATPEYNRQATARLRRQLTQGMYGFRPVKGEYRGFEKSVVISNISKRDLLELGKEYKQHSVVFGERVQEGDYVGMDFYLLGTDSDNFAEELGRSRVFVNRKNPVDYYTEYKGRKFVIPFFGVDDIKSELEDWEEKEVKDYSDTSWEGGAAKPTSIKRVWVNKNDPDRTMTEEEYEKFARLAKKAANTVGSASWNYRGMLKKLGA